VRYRAQGLADEVTPFVTILTGRLDGFGKIKRFWPISACTASRCQQYENGRIRRTWPDPTGAVSG